MSYAVSRRSLFGGISILSLGALPLTARAQTPATAPGAPPAVEVFAAPAFVDQVALSPDGKTVALVTQRGDDKLLFYMNLADRKPQFQNMGKEKIRGLAWGDNTHILVISSSTMTLPLQFDKQELFFAHITNIVTGKVVNPADKLRKGFYNTIAAPRRVRIGDSYRLYAASFGDVQGSCLFSYDLDGGYPELVATAPDLASGFLVAPDGYVLACEKFDSLHKKWTLYANQNPPGKGPDFRAVYVNTKDISTIYTPGIEGLGRNGDTILISIPVDGDPEKPTYHEVTRDGQVGPALNTGGEGREPLFHPVTRRLAGWRSHDDFVSNNYFDPLMKKLDATAQAAMGDDYRVVVRAYAEDPRKIILYGESAQDAGTYYFADFSNGGNQLIAHNYPDLPEAWITQKQAIDYKAADGLGIHAYLTLPPYRAAKNLPLIVLPHGGPRARDYIEFDWQAQCLAANGYAVLQPNYRGSTGYGQAFLDAGNGQWGRKMQTDLSDGVRYLAARGLVDPKRVAILGASYGGYAALAGATLDPGVYNCAVSIAGPSDLAAMVAYADSEGGASLVDYWKEQMGPSSQLDAVSPAKQAARADCPILLIHGTDDTVVPYNQSERMESALKSAGKPVEFITYKGQDHWETVGSSRVEMMKSALAFLQKHNPA